VQLATTVKDTTLFPLTAVQCDRMRAHVNRLCDAITGFHVVYTLVNDIFSQFDNVPKPTAETFEQILPDLSYIDRKMENNVLKMADGANEATMSSTWEKEIRTNLTEGSDLLLLDCILWQLTLP
jgi:hypothetical protein